MTLPHRCHAICFPSNTLNGFSCSVKNGWQLQAQESNINLKSGLRGINTVYDVYSVKIVRRKRISGYHAPASFFSP